MYIIYKSVNMHNHISDVVVSIFTSKVIGLESG